MSAQPSLPGMPAKCCAHPPDRHVAHVASEAVPGDTWDYDGCLDCRCEINERNRRPTREAA